MSLVREEPVAVLAQFPPQLLVVVDAAVPADGQSQLRIDHRLCARLGQVDDLQAAMAQRDAALRPHACAIRAPGCHRLGHGRDSSDVRCLAVETHLAGGSAHPVDPTRWASSRNRGGSGTRLYETPSSCFAGFVDLLDRPGEPLLHRRVPVDVEQDQHAADEQRGVVDELPLEARRRMACRRSTSGTAR